MYGKDCRNDKKRTPRVQSLFKKVVIKHLTSIDGAGRLKLEVTADSNMNRHS